MKYYYRQKKVPKKTLLRISALCIFLIGITISLYIVFPFVSWTFFFAPVFASNSVAAPIPQTTIVNPVSIQALFSQAAARLSGVDYTNAENWFPEYKVEVGKPRVSSYTLSIPKLKIKDATVSTVDYDLGLHLINYIGTALPPDKGTAVVFGHSTLPQLFNPKDYKTIFANAYTLKVGDEMSVTSEGVTYFYKVYSIRVVDSNDTSVFTQKSDDSYLTLVTCTPPGTTWKRLLIESRLQKI